MTPRPITTIDRDLLAVCHRIGALAMQAEMALQEPNTDELARACEGLSAVLRERRAAKAAKEGAQ